MGIGRKAAFKRGDIESLLARVKDLPKKSETKEELNVSELVEKIWPVIGKMRNKGYNYNDIAKWLVEEAGVKASVETMKSALGDASSRHKKRTRKPREEKVVTTRVSPVVKTIQEKATPTPSTGSKNDLTKKEKNVGTSESQSPLNRDSQHPVFANDEV